MKALQFLPIAATALALVVSGCTKQDRTAANTAVQDAAHDTKVAMSNVAHDTRAAMSNAWNDVRDYSYDRRNDFTRAAKAMSSDFDAKMSKLRADYSEATASASRKAAMNELKRDEADYRQKLDALGNATGATWDAAKNNVIAAWDKVQASYHRAMSN
jgi:hypothetical protein